MGLEPLLARLTSQVGDSKEVEIISLLDNKSMSVGRKRQALFQLARGRYVCQIDDDDGVEDDFVKTILSAIKDTQNNPPEVISFQQRCDIDGQIMFVECDIKYTATSEPKQDPETGKILIKRCPWHWCCWRSDIAKKGEFYDCNGVEDSLFPRQMKEIVTKEHKIQKVLLQYMFRSSGTASPYYKIDESNPPKICSLKMSE
jgi:hypothetical protein